MLAGRVQRDSKRVRRQIMPTASVGMAPIVPELRDTAHPPFLRRYWISPGDVEPAFDRTVF